MKKNFSYSAWVQYEERGDTLTITSIAPHWDKKARKELEAWLKNYSPKIEVGKYYRTKGGYKVRVYEVYDGYFHGAYQCGTGMWNIRTWYVNDLSTPFDIVEPW